MAGAGGARIGDYDAINCGGFPGPELRYMPNSRCGTVQIYGHSGDFTTDHYGAHIFNSDNVRQPQLNFISGFDAAGLNDSTFRPMFIESSSGCYGGGVRMHSGAVFLYGLNYSNANYCTVSPGGVSLDGTYTYAVTTANACVGIQIPDLTLAGAYLSAVRWTDATDLCAVDVTPLTEPTAGLFNDESTGLRHNRVMRAPGYDMKEVTTGTTIDAAGYREIRLNYSSSATITNVTGLQQCVPLKLTSMNANPSVAHQAGGVGQAELSGAATRTMGTRSNLVMTGHITGSAGSYAYRCIEANPSIAVSKLVGDTATALGIGSINLGHASDTTISRLSAGKVGIEGVEIVTHATIPALTSKATPVDADELALVDSAASNALKKLTWANLKAALATWLETLTATWSNKTLTAPTISQFDLGNADTTVTRSSAGQIAVEGNPVGTNVAVPSSASATGVLGQWAVDSNFVYYCTAANTWVRAAVAAW